MSQTKTHIDKQHTLSRSEQKFQDITQAAKQAFLEFGVQGTSMDKLAELAQVSKRTIYNHFKNKEELVIHLLAELWNNAMVELYAPYQSDQPVRDQLESILRKEVDFISSQEYLDLSRVAFGYFFYKPEELKKALEQFNKNETALLRWIKEADADKQFKNIDCEFAHEQLHSLIKGQCFWPQLLNIEPALSNERKVHLVATTVDMFLNQYCNVN